MVTIGNEFVLLYHHKYADPPLRHRVRVISVDDNSFDVQDCEPPCEVWTVFRSEIERGVVTIEEASMSDDDDAMFEALMGDIHLDVSSMEDVPDYKTMTKQQLMDMFIEVKEQLADAGHMFVQPDDKSKDLRTQYDAIQMEMARRRGNVE